MGVVIGITCGHDHAESGRFYVNEPYVRAVEAAGGVPILLPPVARLTEAGAAALLGRIDGLLLPGGYDLDPVHYGEEPLPGQGRIEPLCDALELALVRRALRERLPILGICRGSQALNVAAGGTLYQDIASQRPAGLLHRQAAPVWYPTHRVQVEPGTRLAALMEGIERVNTFHHQAVRDVAPGFRVAARASDGLIEAIEAEGEGFALGVQWHPEGMYERDPRYGRVFAALVEAAR